MPNDGATLPKPADGVPRDAGGDAPTEIVAVDPVSGPSGNIAHDGSSTPICTTGPCTQFFRMTGAATWQRARQKGERRRPQSAPLQSAPAAPGYPTGGVGSFMNLR